MLLLALCVTGAIGSTMWMNSFERPYTEYVPYFTYTQANSGSHTPSTEGFLNFWTFVIVLQVSSLFTIA